MIGMWLDDSQRIQFQFYLEPSIDNLSNYNDYVEEIDDVIEEGMDFSLVIRDFIEKIKED
jgi:hypothetical protein